MPTEETTRHRIKQLIVESLHLDGVDAASIGDDEPLMGDRFGLDSVDALELVVVLEKEFDIRIDDQTIDPEAFSTVARLAETVDRLRNGPERHEA